VTAEPAQWLALAHARGRAAWPAIAVDLDELAAAVAEGGGDDAAELYLACACQRGDPLALAAFRDRYFAPLEPALKRMGLDAPARDDAWQVLSARLFVATAERPARIVAYAGSGQLRGLVKVAATRIALDLLEQRDRQVPDTWLDRVPGAASDPELHWIKRQHRAELKEEVEAAIAELPARDRALLRLTIVERLGIDAIAASYRTHRATVARWIVRARNELAARVRARLAERWRISEAELAQIRPLVDSQLDLSLERLLAG
jgi:RNA polymerase sigma-70 factor (ECF subfamily)